MKRIGLFVMVFMAIGAQSQSQIRDLIQSSEVTTSAQKIYEKLDDHVSILQQRKAKFHTDQAFLADVFDYTHRKFLRAYVPYSQFNELMERGRYDCLSATALFSVIFDQLEFPYQIIETNYHIFMMVQTSQGQVLIETTDRFNGVVTEPYQIEARINSYQQNQLISAGRNFYTYQANIYRSVNSSEVIGLLYFNQAVRLYNNHQLALCSEKLDEAINRYPNPRAEELAVILFHSIQASNLSDEMKSQLSDRYQKYLAMVRPVLASR